MPLESDGQQPNTGYESAFTDAMSASPPSQPTPTPAVPEAAPQAAAPVAPAVPQSPAAGQQPAVSPAVVPNVPQDPLKFRDKKKYTDRLKDAQTKTGEKDAIIVGEGTIDSLPVIVAAFNFDFMGGSMGAAVGEGLVRAAETAVAKNAALITIPASGGARMQEGMVSLIQLPRTVIAVQMVKDAGLPFIVLLTDPTTGGVSASFAMLGDIHIAEPGCMIGFAGKRVIEETIREQLPAGFQTAEYCRDHGMVDLVIPRKELPETFARILGLLMRRNSGGASDRSGKGGNGTNATKGKGASMFAGNVPFAAHTTVNALPEPANEVVPATKKRVAK